MKRLILALICLFVGITPVWADTVDLAVTLSDGVSTRATSNTANFIVTVTNAGPGDATNAIVYFGPPGYTGVTWTCAASLGSTCGASGTKYVHDTADILAGGNATYTVATTANKCAGGNVSAQAAVYADTGDTDISAGNNSTSETNEITAPIQCNEPNLKAKRYIPALSDGSSPGYFTDATYPYPLEVKQDYAFSAGDDKCSYIFTLTPQNMGDIQNYVMAWRAGATGTHCWNLWLAAIPSDATDFVYGTDIDFATNPNILRFKAGASDINKIRYDTFTMVYADNPFWKTEQGDDCGNPTESRCKLVKAVALLCRDNTTDECATTDEANGTDSVLTILPGIEAE